MKLSNSTRSFLGRENEKPTAMDLMYLFNERAFDSTSDDFRDLFQVAPQIYSDY